jgi:hypothetical protein
VATGCKLPEERTSRGTAAGSELPKENVPHSLDMINQPRAGRNLPPIRMDLLQLRTYYNADRRLKKAVPLRGRFAI